MTFLLKNRFYILNLLFITFLLFFQKPLIGLFHEVIYQNTQNYRLAIGILAVIILESIGAYRKVPNLQKRTGIFNGGGIFFGLILHAVVGVVLVMNGLAAISGKGFEDATMETRLSVFIFLEVIRHLVVPIMISFKIDKNIPTPPAKEFLGDIFLLIWACVSYAGTRGVMTTGGGMGLGGPNIGLSIFYTILAAFLFLIFYIPTNLIFLTEQLGYTTTKRHFSPAKREEIWFYINILIVITLALYPLYSIPAKS